MVLDKFSPVRQLIQMVRDEAHRFAVTFHRARRSASRVTSELLDVPGLGPKTAEKLLKHFGSLERVRAATEGEWMRVAGRTAARRMKEYWAREEAASR